MSIHNIGISLKLIYFIVNSIEKLHFYSLKYIFQRCRRRESAAREGGKGGGGGGRRQRGTCAPSRAVLLCSEARCATRSIPRARRVFLQVKE